MKIQNYDYLNQSIDVSEQFHTLGNISFLAQSLREFNGTSGLLSYSRFERKGRIAFNMYSTPFEQSKSWTFPPVYSDTPEFPFSVEFTGENVLRIRTSCRTSGSEPLDENSLMLDAKPKALDVKPIKCDDISALYRTKKMEVEVVFNPFHVIIRDENGKELTHTLHSSDSMCLQNYNPMPCSFVRSAKDMKKYNAFSFTIKPDEHFYGCGESFTRLDKLGQKVALWTKDANGVETDDMYKPIPFFMSSRGYGMFYHTSCPTTFDFGKEYAEAQTAYLGDENIDLFIFTGTPREILKAYTDLTGHSPTLPLWSYGLWMSRISYKSEEETRAVAADLQKHRIPCDVIHLDTNWFEEDWLCNYKFASRFDNAEKMIKDLRDMGYKTCLWQIPYFTPKNELYEDIMNKKLAVYGDEGELPTDDAILDYSNPQAVKWYQDKLENLFNMGVCAIKADFGEAAPLTGRYFSGKSGFAEHNLYPLRYNKAVYDVTKKATGEGIIWGRSAWAGSQRYPLHWGGDCENTDMGMLSSLRGGLSFGISGFSYWSHDVGGFVRKSPEELYNRWVFMGIFTSHMRCHGAPPKEPWAYSKEFCHSFKRMVELRYRLMPYIMAQANQSSELGLPMARAMFIDFPQDPTCLSLEDQYMFGNDILVAPLFEKSKERKVYLPKGSWMELSTKEIFEGGKWHIVAAGEIPGLAFVKGGAIIPVANAVLTTDEINWNDLAYYSFNTGEEESLGLVPEANLSSNRILTKEDITHGLSTLII